MTAADRRVPRGDEAELFRLFHPRLLSRIRRTVRASPETVEDACLYAWGQFIQQQPDRERNWRAWLVRTAEREAWRLRRLETREARLDIGDEDRLEESVAWDIPSRRPNADVRERLREALQALASVSERRREAKALQLTGYSYNEIAEMLGLTYTRVNRLLVEANDAIRKHQETSHSAERALPPRAQRLRDLETNPPRWLVAAIGRRPAPINDQSGALAWRRAALALDDYRNTHGKDLGDEPLGVRPEDPEAARAFDLADSAMRRSQSRRVERGLGVGRGEI